MVLTLELRITMEHQIDRNMDMNWKPKLSSGLYDILFNVKA